MRGEGKERDRDRETEIERNRDRQTHARTYTHTHTRTHTHTHTRTHAHRRCHLNQHHVCTCALGTTNRFALRRGKTQRTLVLHFSPPEVLHHAKYNAVRQSFSAYNCVHLNLHQPLHTNNMYASCSWLHGCMACALTNSFFAPFLLTDFNPPPFFFPHHSLSLSPSPALVFFFFAPLLSPYGSDSCPQHTGSALLLQAIVSFVVVTACCFAASRT